MTTTWACIIAFLIVFAFMLGQYFMFRVSEHYNRKIRDIIEDREEEKRLFSGGPVLDTEMKIEPVNKPKRRPRKKPDVEVTPLD